MIYWSGAGSYNKQLVNNSFEPWHLMRCTRTTAFQRKYGDEFVVQIRINVPKIFKWYSMRIVQIRSDYTWKAQRILHFHLFRLFANDKNSCGLCGTQFRYHFNVCYLLLHPYFVNGCDSIKSTVKSDKIRFLNKRSGRAMLLICVIPTYFISTWSCCAWLMWWRNARYFGRLWALFTLP